MRLLDLVRRMYSDDFQLLKGDMPFISSLAGHREFEDPNWDTEELIRRYDRESEAFRLRKAKYEIYPKGN